MESYKKHLADNPKVAMIHYSLDEDETEAAKWAKKENFPWLTILRPGHEAVDLEKFSAGFVPDYILLSKDGEILAKGKEECFQKIEALGKSVAAN